MSQPTQKRPNIWALASLTYGAVIAVAIISVLAYYYVAPKQAATQQQLTDAERSMPVGSVWIPIYPGGTVEGTASSKQDNTIDSRLNFATKDPTDRVLSFYQAALKKGAFRFNTVTKTDGGGMVRSMAHDGKTTVVVTIQAAGTGSTGEIRTVDRDTDDKGRPK